MERDAFLKMVEEKAKNTVGYAEAENKQSFIVGAQVAASTAYTLAKAELDSAKSEWMRYEQLYRSTYQDISTLASIVKQYTEVD